MVVCLFTNDNVLFVENEDTLERAMDQFYSVYTRMKLKLNAGKK